MPTQPGTQIGEYTLIRPLGSGGMGEVWLAKKDGIGKPFVVKLLLPELCTNPAHRRRFLREAKIVAELPEGNIVPVVDYGEAGDRLFLVMAFIDGVNLQTFNEAVLARGGRLPFTVVVGGIAHYLFTGKAPRHVRNLVELHEVLDRPPPSPRVDCGGAPDEAKAAARARNWTQVLRLTRSRDCWDDNASRVRLRVGALAQLRRYAECAALAQTVDDLETNRAGRSCAAAIEASTP